MNRNFLEDNGIKNTPGKRNSRYQGKMWEWKYRSVVEFRKNNA
jgi:hypothetical protein